MRTLIRWLQLVFLTVFICDVSPGFAASASAAPARDDYIAGYATAVVEREMRLTARDLSVKDGVVTISGNLTAPEREKLVAALSGIPGVLRIDIADPKDLAGTQPPPPRTTTTIDEKLPVGFLRPSQLFKPLIADPRWPHFSLAYRNYIGDKEIKNVGSANFGESIALYRSNGPFGGQ